MFLIVIASVWATMYGIDVLDSPYTIAALFTGSVVGVLAFFGMFLVHEPPTYPESYDQPKYADKLFGDKDQYPDEEIVEVHPNSRRKLIDSSKT